MMPDSRYRLETPQALLRWVCLTVTLSGMACMLSHSALSQELAAEQQVFNNACRTCHTLKEGDNRQGPNLHGIIGRKAGSLPGYAYSSAMKDAGFVWDKEKLDRFIASPDEVVPGHKMTPYSGLTSAGEPKSSLFCNRSQPLGRDTRHRQMANAGFARRKRSSAALATASSRRSSIVVGVRTRGDVVASCGHLDRSECLHLPISKRPTIISARKLA